MLLVITHRRFLSGNWPCVYSFTTAWKIILIIVFTLLLLSVRLDRRDAKGSKKYVLFLFVLSYIFMCSVYICINIERKKGVNTSVYSMSSGASYHPAYSYVYVLMYTSKSRAPTKPRTAYNIVCTVLLYNHSRQEEVLERRSGRFGSDEWTYVFLFLFFFCEKKLFFLNLIAVLCDGNIMLM